MTELLILSKTHIYFQTEDDSVFNLIQNDDEKAVLILIQQSPCYKVESQSLG